MSESSKSRPDEYDSITYHHWQEFEIRRLKRSSEDFQQLFEDIMVRARPGFIRVRPYGNIGDRKCDGLFRDDSIFFQVYSPDELEQAKVQKKIDEDLDGAVAHWGDALKTWLFVYNVRRGVPPDILGTLQEKQKQYPDIKIDHLSNDALWEITRGLSVEQRNEILGLPPSSTAKIQQTPALLTNSQEHQINWQEICRGMLPIELDANPLISGDGVTLGIEDIVPVDLVERKERPKPTRDSSPENSQQALEDQEIPLPYNQFFDHILIGCRSLNQQGKGVAIIGEPGAGKTTLLCAIADWIMKQGELPIFISLQDLEAGLEPYLLETWLRNAIRKRKAPEQLQDDLIEQCNAGRVWLLLDGVDEMAQSNQSLFTLAKEFRGWVGDARIVLTCRVNVWEAKKNELRSKFEVYRSRGLKDEEQLIFIQNFFKKAKQVEAGSKLIDKLKNAPPRLKDLIKNPLWITLLCRTWKQEQGELPATKAELYQRFTKTFYDWKNKLYIPEEKRLLLERALGELAKNAIDREDFRFRLRETFIRQELDKFDSSLFGIACELGWINKLGSAVENPDEPVYAFLHPTFQEYFAALALSKYSNPLVLTHHIFEPHWKEVILIAAGIINNPIDFLRELKGRIDEFLVENDKLQDFLVWAANKSFSIIKLSPDIKYKPAAIRAFYLQFLSPRFVKLFLSTQLISKIDAQLAEDWNTSSSDYNSDPCKELVLDVYLMIALDYAYQRIEDVGRNIDNDYIAIYPDYYVKLCMNLSSDTKFKEKLEVLLVELESRQDENSILRLYKWWQINHKAWIQNFLKLITEHRDIGWDWELSRRDLELLMNYIDANELLIDCVYEGSIELALKEKIKDKLFLPSITYIARYI
jgi:hypothetical protein